MIIQELKEVNFPFLQYLYLGGNMVESVEGFNQIYLPELRQLWISNVYHDKDDNNIRFLTNLKKGYWPKICGIALGKNAIKKTKTK